MYRKRYIPLLTYHVWIFFILVVISSSFLSERGSRSVSADEREYFLHQLRDNLNTVKSLEERLHLAEYLIDLQFKKEIYDSFSQIDLTQDSLADSFKCDIYRILTLSAQNEDDRNAWIKRINELLEHGNVQEQIIAAESLAKLRSTPDPELVSSLLDTTQNIHLRTVLQWSSAFESQQREDEIKALFINNCTDSSIDPEVRRVSAYALGYSFYLTKEQQEKLREAALKIDTNASAYKYLLWSSYVLSSDKSDNLPAFSELEDKWISLSRSENISDKYLTLNALARNGKPKDVDLLKTIFSQTLKEDGSKDILYTSAYAILKIDRKEPYRFSILDWGVIALYFVMMILIGVYYSRKNKSTKDFILGGKTMGSFSIGLSLFATMLSSLSYLSYPGEMIRYGPVIFGGMFAFPITHWVVGWYIIPRFMKEDVVSAYELLEKKLGKSIRYMASFFFISLRFMWMATIIYATIDTAISAIFDISPFQRVAFSTLLLIITLIYSSIGGLKAIVMTDVIQTFLLWTGAFLTIVLVSIHLGSVSSWIPDHWLPHWSPLKWGFNATERLTIGNAMLMLFIWYVCTSGSDQMAIQRYLATKDLKAARRSFGISLLSNLLVKILLGLVGLALLAFFFKNPHLLHEGKSVLEQSDIFFPRFIVVGFPIGLAGLVFAGLLAAAMSSLSSGMNSTATVISEDWLNRFRKRKNNSENALRRIKQLSATVGIIVLILSFAVGYVQGNLFDVVIKVVNLVVAPLFVLFFMALFIPFATEKGTFIAGILSIIFAISIAFFEFLGIKALWIMPASLIFGVVTGVIASYVEVILNKSGNL